MITTDLITKAYGDITAVDRITLEIQKGELFGLLGPNGAGKSTFIHMLTGLIRPDSGTVEINGLSPEAQPLDYKRQIGLVPQDLSFYGDLSARQNISYFAGLYGLRGNIRKDAVDRALEFTGLKDSGNQFAKTFSGGMKRRLNIACGIVHSPSVIFLDEPTVGIDPQSRHHILQSVEKLRKNGCTVLYTTHYMEEAEAVCSRIAIIDKGKIIALGTRGELQQLVEDAAVIVFRLKQYGELDRNALEGIPGVRSAEIRDNQLRVTVETGIHNINGIVQELIAQRQSILDIHTSVPNLESVFLRLTGRNLRD